MDLYAARVEFFEWLTSDDTLSWYLPLIGMVGALAGLGYITYRREQRESTPSPEVTETVHDRVTIALNIAVDQQLISQADADYWYRKFQKVGLMPVPPHNKPSWYQELWAKTSLNPWRWKAVPAPAKQASNASYFNPKRSA